MNLGRTGTVPTASNTAREYPPSAIRAMFERVSAFDDVASLTVGEPDFDTPPHIVEAAVESMRAGGTRYTPNAGIPALRDAVAELYSERWGRALHRENVVVTVGGQEGMFLALRTAVDPGDDVLVPNPSYANYRGQIHLVGANAVDVELSAENGFVLTASQIEAALTPRTRALILNTPANPMGAVVPQEELQAIAALAEENGFIVVSDEVYERIVHDGDAHVSIAQAAPEFERFLMVGSVSKAYAMTGWRVGYIIGPEALLATTTRMKEGVTSCSPEFVQRAAIAALTGPQEDADAMLEAYRSRRELIVAGLTAIPGVSCAKAGGAFYVFADIRPSGLGSDEFAERLLVDHRVAVIPGTAFGSGGEGFVRLSYATDEATIRRGLAGIASLMESTRT
ncbi:pyridoxal phosphate-dependent aminotransferase [Brevibacterium album]|uniref:pyridoxal phosphate-dependent aminotransferase n=1 Tax=Brevibacterium album TaxID=417948 RepID=UPI000428D008|nr:pyridoxal phosphate-dependent aminotransferase [Brevibacterium album]